MSAIDETNRRIAVIFARHNSAENADYREVAFDLARRIDRMMMRVANTPIPEGQEALDLFGSLASDLRDLARGEV